MHIARFSAIALTEARRRAVHAMTPIRHRCLVLGVALPLLAHAAAAADDVATPPRNRAESLVDAFEVMCNLHAPDFDALSAYAKGIRMQALADTTGTTPGGEALRERAWLGGLTDGPFALRIEQMRGVKGVSTSCAIDGPAPDADAFRAAVMRAHRLATAPAPQIVDGSIAYYWDAGVNGDDSGNTSLVVRSVARSGKPFVQVKLLTMVKAAP